MSLDFTDNTTDGVNCGTGMDNLDPLTVMAVFRPDAVGGFDAILHKQLADNFEPRHVQFYHDAQDIVFIRSWSTLGAIAVSTGDIISADTDYIVFCVDGGLTVAPRIYFAVLGNDLAEPSYATQQTPTGTLTDDSASTWIIGRLYTVNTRAFQGTMSRVMIFNKALSLDESRAVYHLALSAGAHSLQMWQELGYDGTDTQRDFSGNGNDGTLTGSPTVADHAPLSPPFGFDIAMQQEAAAGGRVMSSLVAHGGLAAPGGIAGIGGGLAG